MVLRIGSNMKNHSLTQLVRDMRNVMQPHTAIKLRERKSNKLKDFVVMAGPLNVSHLLVFSQSESGTTQLRLGRMSRGPTITFKIENYSLAKDVRRILKHPKSVTKESKEFLNPPLLVLNGFTNPQKAEPHEKLLITTFQNMFPPIQPHSTRVSSVKRVLMINKDPETGLIDLRHYAIDTKPVEGSKTVKKLINAKHNLNKRLPNLGKATDVSDLILDPYANGAGFTSDSEVEDDSIVDVKEDSTSSIPKKKTEEEQTEPVTNARKKAIKLTELGPRLRLTMTKIEEGVCSGKVLYHHNIKKSKSEVAKLEAKHAERQKVKDERKQIQSDNIASKKAKKEAKKERRKQREEERKANGEAADGDEEESDDSESEDDDEAIPEDLDSDLYSDVDEIESDDE